MIVFDLQCTRHHVFEAWFASSVDWALQREAGQIACPICGDPDITKAVMAPAVSIKGNCASGKLAPEMIKAAMQAIAAEQTKALANSTWVGADFATRARAMHSGDEKRATIHGQATLADAKALVDEGVPVAPLPLPITPPKDLN